MFSHWLSGEKSLELSNFHGANSRMVGNFCYVVLSKGHGKQDISCGLAASPVLVSPAWSAWSA